MLFSTFAFVTMCDSIVNYLSTIANVKLFPLICLIYARICIYMAVIGSGIYLTIRVVIFVRVTLNNLSIGAFLSQVESLCVLCTIYQPINKQNKENTQKNKIKKKTLNKEDN